MLLFDYQMSKIKSIEVSNVVRKWRKSAPSLGVVSTRVLVTDVRSPARPCDLLWSVTGGRSDMCRLPAEALRASVGSTVLAFPQPRWPAVTQREAAASCWLPPWGECGAGWARHRGPEAQRKNKPLPSRPLRSGGCLSPAEPSPSCLIWGWWGSSC